MTTYFLRANWGWVVTFSFFLHSISLLGILYSYSVLFLSFQREFNTGAMATGWVGTLSYSLMSLLSPLSSLISRRLGYRTASILGVVLFCLGMFTTSFATQLWHTFLSFSVLTGFGSNLVIIADNGQLGRWFQGKGYYRASVLVTCGSSVGIIVMSLSVTSLEAAYGWRDCQRLLSAVNLVVCVLAALTLRDPETMAGQPRSKPAQNEPKEETSTGIALRDQSRPRPDQPGPPTLTEHATETRVCDPETSADRTAVETRLAPVEAPPGKSESGGGVDDGLNLSVFRCPYTWLYCVAIILGSKAYTFATVNLASFMEGLNFTNEDTTLTISLFAIGECFGKIIVAILSNMVSFSLMYINGGSSVVAAIIVGVMAFADSLPSLILCAFVFGMMKSALFGLVFGASQELFGAYGMPTVSFLGLMPFGIGGLIAAPLTGGLYDITGDYTLSLLVILACFLCSAMCFFLIPRLKRSGRLLCFIGSNRSREEISPGT